MLIYVDYTALIYASTNGYTEIVRMLLKIPHIDVNCVNQFGNTALIYASIRGYTEIVRMLLKIPEIDVNHVNQHGNTALILASRYGHTEIGILSPPGACALIVKMLLEIPHIDVNHANQYGDTALILATKYGNTKIIKMLQDYIFLKENEWNPEIHEHFPERTRNEILQSLLLSERGTILRRLPNEIQDILFSYY